MWRNASRRLAVAVAMAVLASAAPALAAGVTLFSFSGVVTDVLGRPLVAATVSDGSRSATTDASGAYVLAEDSTGGYVLSASRSDTYVKSVAVDATLPLDQTVSFQLLYRIVGVLSRASISTASSGATETLSLTSKAPLPGAPGESGGRSCVDVLDTRTGARSAATLMSVSSSESSWGWTLALPQAAEEGVHRLEYRAVDCSSGAILTRVESVGYVIDNTPPTVFPQTMAPLDNGNTVFGAAQPIVVRLKDHGHAGVDPSSISFTRTAEDGTSASISGASVAYNSSTQWATTAAQSFPVGSLHRLSVTVSDRAGNTATIAHRALADGGGFLSTVVTPSAGSAHIPPTECTVSGSVNPATGMKSAECPNVPLVFADSTTYVGGTRHGDAGYVKHTASMETAQMTTDVAGVPVSLPAYRSGQAQWRPRTEPLRFVAPDATPDAQTLTVHGATVQMGTLTADVPATWTTATLEMGATVTAVALTACANPAAVPAKVMCLPDPLQNNFHVVLPTGTADPAAAAQQQATKHGFVVGGVDGEAEPATYTARMPYERAAALANDPAARFVFRDLPQDTFDVGGSDCATIYTRLRLQTGLDPAQRGAATTFRGDATQCDATASFDSASAVGGGSWRFAQTCQGVRSFEWLASSHTFQRFTIDLGWLRSAVRRGFDGCIGTWWTRGAEDHGAWTGSGTGWEHTDPRFLHVDWRCTQGAVGCEEIQTRFAGSFVHGCFLNHDHVTTSKQAWTANRDGTAALDVRTIGACIGVDGHHTYDKGSERNDYGGHESDVYAVPPPGV